MNKIGIAIIAALLLVGCAGVVANPAAGEVIQGRTVAGGPACSISDLDTESKALIVRWWLLNQKREDNTLTDKERQQGFDLQDSGKCGLLLGDIPIVIVLLDGTINLARFPDGSLAGLMSGSFVEGEKVYKEFR